MLSNQKYVTYSTQEKQKYPHNQPTKIDKPETKKESNTSAASMIKLSVRRKNVQKLHGLV